jgi:hypothetical protein
MSKIIYRTTMTIMGVVFIAMLAYIYMLVSETSPVYYTNIPFPVVGKTVYNPGETVYFKIKRCVTRDIPYSFTSNLIDDNTGKVYPLPSVEVSAKKGCSEVLSIPTVIPDIPQGKYHKDFKIFAQGNFKNFIIPLTTDSFYILSNLTQEEVFGKQTVVNGVTIISATTTPLVPKELIKLTK